MSTWQTPNLKTHMELIAGFFCILFQVNGSMVTAFSFLERKDVSFIRQVSSKCLNAEKAS